MHAQEGDDVLEIALHLGSYLGVLAFLHQCLNVLKLSEHCLSGRDCKGRTASEKVTPTPSLDLLGIDLCTTEDEDDLSSSITSDAFSRFTKPSSISWL